MGYLLILSEVFVCGIIGRFNYEKVYCNEQI